ncbi:hypothetical protein PSTT_00516 [Puccinia striiformis]|uniref:Uncharacterized protein n=2 Tax=Puccinia striiformis TaxID=27350 RepID=A0A0L0V8X7_9BASI|nr:hypothetical protein PSTG_10950 [Puccinia striiformis f. sp. tritici PST-78]POW17666.1 hypothetical protein PSTT_00516 [Puccinia striiformis]
MWKVSGGACSLVGTRYKISLPCFPAIPTCEPYHHQSVKFAKSGLQNPKVNQLDNESKISSALQMALLSVVPIKKEAVLSVSISNVVGLLTASMTDTPKELAGHQTIVFLATKHPLNYLGGLLIAARDSDIRISENVIKSGSENGHEELNHGD